MKYNSPTVYVLHKVKGKLAKSAFKFTGFVDRRRMKREILKAFKRGGEIVSPLYIEESIAASLRLSQTVPEQAVQSIKDAEDAAAQED